MCFRRFFLFATIFGLICGISFTQASDNDRAKSIVISEVSVAGISSSKDEYIELFNPLEEDINLTGYLLYKYTASQSLQEDAQLIADLENRSISARGFLLVAHADFFLSSTTEYFVKPDVVYGAGSSTVSVANNNAVVLRKQEEIIDMVGMGSARVFEGAAASNPSKGKTIERVPGSSSGHDTDTQNNKSDFERASRSPNNAQSNPIILYVNQAPTAELKVSLLEAQVFEEVVFDVGASTDPEGDVLMYTFDFADGTVESTTTTVVTHAFSEPGSYLVQVHVSDETSSSSASRLLQVVKPSVPPEEKVTQVFINEINARPREGSEWIELYNPSAVAVELVDWQLEDNAKTTAFSVVIPSYGYALVTSTNRLNNGGDVVRIKNPSAVVVDEVFYGSFDDTKEVLAPGKGQSLARKEGVFVVTQSPTPGALNVFDPIVAEESFQKEMGEASVPEGVIENTADRFAIGSILISELVSDPSDAKVEFVEFVNTTKDSINLSGWFVQEGNERKTLLPDRTLRSKEYIILEKPKGNLNNSGDIVLLYDKDGQIVDQVTYGDFDDGNKDDNAPAAPDPYSLIRKNMVVDTDTDVRDFTLTTQITKGEENILSTPTVVQEERVVATPMSALDRSKHIRIHALLANPVGSDDAEYIELINLGDGEVDLSGWRISDATSRDYIIDTLMVAPSSTVKILRTDSGIALNNTGQEAIKLMLPSGAIVHRVEYVGPVQEGAIYQRDMRGQFSWKGIQQKGLEDGATTTLKMQDDSAEEEQAVGGYLPVSPAAIVVSEILPNPVGSDDAEFIELHNPTQDDIDLSGLQIDDGEGGSKPYTFDVGTFLVPGQFLVLPRALTGIVLNNTVDQVRILDQDGVVWNNVVLEEVVEGASYIQNGFNNYVWTQRITPGVENILFFERLEKKRRTLSLGAVPESTTLAELEQFEKGDVVSVAGHVSVMPGVFGTQYFYIQDMHAGVQVYMHTKDFPNLQLGQLVSVAGEISQSAGQRRIKVRGKESIRTLADPIVLDDFVQSMDVADALAGTHGTLVQVAGEITERKGSQMYIDDGTDEIQAYFKKGTQITKSDYQEGMRVEVVGVLVQTPEVTRVLPRSKDDIRVLEQRAIEEIVLPVDKKDETSYWVYAIAILIVLGALFYRKKSATDEYTEVG